MTVGDKKTWQPTVRYAVGRNIGEQVLMNRLTNVIVHNVLFGIDSRDGIPSSGSEFIVDCVHIRSGEQLTLGRTSGYTIKIRSLKNLDNFFREIQKNGPTDYASAIILRRLFDNKIRLMRNYHSGKIK